MPLAVTVPDKEMVCAPVTSASITNDWPVVRPWTFRTSWNSVVPFERTCPLFPVQVIPGVLVPPLDPDPDAPEPLPGAVVPPPPPQPARTAHIAMAVSA